MADSTDLNPLRHSLAHLLGAALTDLYPGTQLTIGPAIDNGFYYDALLPEKLSDGDLVQVEARMRELAADWAGFERHEVTPDEARARFAGNPFKLELIDEIAAKGEPVTLYTSGSFTDLCRGGHVESMQDVDLKGFALTKVAGAYWRGDESKPMLTRVYGIAFETKEELGAYQEMLAEAAKRDHRVLGKQLDLYAFSDLVGPGLPLFTPKGTALRMELQRALMEISRKYDTYPVTIPHIAKIELYETSGHAQKFGDELFQVKGHYQDFVMKPVNCPHHTQIYASRPRSYRDLPLRYIESTMQYRDEKPGEIGGLTRVRAITVDDGHTFCRVDQIKQEAVNIGRIIEEFYTGLGMYGNHWVSLSVRDPQTPDRYIGEEEGWQQAERMLQEVSDELGLDARRMEGEAALYGPKLDYMFTDALGKERQLATIQIDFAMPKRFGLTYTDASGAEETPVIIHRAVLGSYERFMAILIEHFAGAFPLWLSPVQVRVLPVSDKFAGYADEVLATLKAAGLRVELATDDSLGKRIRAAEVEKVPLTVVVGEKEEGARTVSVRNNRTGEQHDHPLADFAAMLAEASRTRAS